LLFILFTVYPLWGVLPLLKEFKREFYLVGGGTAYEINEMGVAIFQVAD